MASNEFHLRTVQSARGIARFVDVPWRLDRALGADPHWVPPLRTGVKSILAMRHPFWQRNRRKLWIAYQDGRPVGRIAAILNREHLDRWRDETGFWGFFEAVDRLDIASALLSAAENWLAQQGCRVAMGPVNPAPHYEMGLLIRGFDSPPFFMLPYNRPYYPALIERAGYEGAEDFHAYLLTRAEFTMNHKVERVSEALRSRHQLTIRGGSIQNFAREAEIIRELYNASMSAQWGYTRLGAPEFDVFARDLKRIVDPDLVLFAENRGRPIGFLLCLPNLNEVFIDIRNGRLLPFGLWKLLRARKRIRSARVLLLGVLPEWQRYGVGSILYDEIARRALERGYTAVEMSWVSENNVLMKRAARLLGGSIHKTYRIYRKTIAAESPAQYSK